MTTKTLTRAELAEHLSRYQSEMLDYALQLSFQSWADAEDHRARAVQLFETMMRTLLA